MTSSVKVAAHCPSDKEVVLIVYDRITGEEYEVSTLKNGQTKEVYVYDNRRVITYEKPV